jgi:sulfur relay (sulfurtransferase) complex TusBCD TusD component (DsrE family)
MFDPDPDSDPDSDSEKMIEKHQTRAAQATCCLGCAATRGGISQPV